MTLKELDSLSEKYKIPAISVDFLNHSYHTVQSKQLDNSRYLICTLTENGIPRAVRPDEIARLRLEKPDKTYVYNECETIEDGRILVTLTEQILAVKGKAQCDIQLTSINGIIYSTKNFIINIDSVPYPLDAIESSDEFDALNDIIAREEERIKIVEELEQTVTENEAVRNENENNRITSENIRNTNETVRQNQETTRQNQEAVRQANENTRITNENSRKENETVRQTNETNRQNNTATAISNAEKATKKANDAADDLQNKLDRHHFVLTEDKDVAGGVPSLDTNRKVPVNELYEATVSSKGITQLTNSVTSTSTTTAATPNSVKIAYDKAVSSENDIKAHSSSSTAHTDIRNLISSLTTRLNTLADSDDTTLDQLSEIVAYIKNNKSLINGITTSKVNVSDIIDNLTSSAMNKPLSAKQGKVLNDLITALTTTVGNKVDKVLGKGLSSNDYTTTEKNKLAGIAANANNYVHPTTAGNKHIPLGGSSGQILRWSTNGTAVWENDNNVTYNNMTAATASTAGKSGLVPAPTAGKQTSFLRGDGTWAIPDQIHTTLTNPVSKSEYYIPFHSNSSNGNKTLLYNNGISYYTKEGTASDDGEAELMLGNSTTSGTAENKRGIIRLYGSGSTFTRIHAQKTATYIDIFLPTSGGTLCLNSHTHNYAGSNSVGGDAINALKLNGYALSISGTKDTWGTVPSIGGSDGVMEVGKYFDFHTTDGNTSDYDCRIMGSTTGFTFTAKSGSATINAGTFSVSSSKRYKENIKDMAEEDAKKLLDISVKRFDYIHDKKDVAGCIAEEVEQLLPDVCTYNSEDETLVEGIDYSKFVPYLIKLAQEQQEQIDNLKEELGRVCNG